MSTDQDPSPRAEGTSPLDRLAGRLFDTLLGLPTPAKPYTVSRDQPVPMPDVAVLLGDLYRPTSARGGAPVVLIRSPYGRGVPVSSLYAAPLARRGYQVFFQSTRGTCGSGGHFHPFTTEKDDGLATLAWLRNQPWCDGRVSMIGSSYLGHTQWAIALYCDPPLTSVSLGTTAARITTAFYDNGAPQLENALQWTTQIGRQERRGALSLLPNSRLERRLRTAVQRLPLQAVDIAVAGGVVPFWRDFLAHAEPDSEYWTAADHTRADVRTMPPVNMTTGWWDLFVREQLQDFNRLRAAGVSARILVGGGMHTQMDLATAREMLRRELEWLDHHVRGGPAPAGAPVRVLLQGTDTWLDLDTWPPEVTTSIQYLRVGQTMSSEPEAATSAPSTFTFDPADPTPSVGGPLLQPPGRQVDNRVVETRPDVLVFTGPPLTESIDLVGPVRACLFVRPELEYTSVFIRLCDVDEEGILRNVVDGIRRLAPRAQRHSRHRRRPSSRDRAISDGLPDSSRASTTGTGKWRLLPEVRTQLGVGCAAGKRTERTALSIRGVS